MNFIDRADTLKPKITMRIANHCLVWYKSTDTGFWGSGASGNLGLVDARRNFT